MIELQIYEWEYIRTNLTLHMTLFEQLQALTTEQINPHTLNIDELGADKVVESLFLQESSVTQAVGNVLDVVASVVSQSIHVMKSGGCMLYVGAGTSGRIGVVDAAEMPPTFGTHPGMVRAIMAGGSQAMFQAVEGAEDSNEDGAESLIAALADVESTCMVIGLSASGRTPFVLGALKKAAELQHHTAFISTNPASVVKQHAPFVDHLICAEVGPEPIAGSTRMKSGTAQKIILNMISTATMVGLGKTYGNVMVDLRLSNAKLMERGKKIIMTLTQCSYSEAEHLLKLSGNRVKTAIVMQKCHCSVADAEKILAQCNGFVRLAVEQHPKM
jgi:N-acetylmuramic acid 6-phosphate etherase